MSKQMSPLVIGGIGLGALYLLSNRSATQSPVIPTGGSAALAVTQTGLYGVNAGPSQPPANYAQLAQAVPNLLNPNYQMSAGENAQYLGNYLDLQQGLQTWIGHKQLNGVKPVNMAQAAQCHWTVYGCAEKRIFLPLQPPSNVPYTPPPANPKSGSGSAILSTALGIATKAAPLLLALLGPGEPDPKLNDGELQLLFTGGAILKDLLPMFMTNDGQLATGIDQHFTALLTPYYS